MAKSNQSGKSAISSSDSLAIAGLFLGVITLMSPHREITVVLCSLLIFFSLCWLIYQYKWDAILTNRKTKFVGCCLALAFSIFLAVTSWPRREVPDIVLKIEPVSLPVKWESDFIYSMEIRGRFPSYVGMGYGPANKRDDYWLSKDTEYPSSALRYTLINRGKFSLYNLKLDLEIIHDEVVAIPNGFSVGKSVYRFASAVNVEELLPYGLTSKKEENFVFYVRNLSEDSVSVVPSEFVTIGSNQKVKIRTFGNIFPLEPPKVWRHSDEKK